MDQNKLYTPVRVQRSRKSKFIPPNLLPTVYVGRPSFWGNPFRVGVDGTIDECVEKYKQRIHGLLINDVKQKLKGKNLSCWCPLHQNCHADVLLKIANS